tara:strand:+ start:1791 stop:3086 length:1296 start_codon:yes stop_codon:yes gene_type:complete
MGKFVTGVASFVLVTLLARMLTTDDMAAYFLASSLVVFLSIIGKFGLDQTLLRLVAGSLAVGDKNKAKTLIIKGGGLVALICSGLAIIVNLSFDDWLIPLFSISSTLSGLNGLIIVWFVALAFQYLLGDIFRSFKEINLSVLLGGTLTALIAILLVSILWFTESSTSLSIILIIMIASCLMNLNIGICILFRKLRKFGVFEPAIINFSDLLQDSWPFCINSMAHYLLVFSGLWILGTHETSINIANYGAAIRLLAFVAITIAIVSSLLTPIIAELNVKKEHDKLQLILRGTATLAACPSIIIILLLFVFSDQTMTLIYGDLYASGSVILNILLVGQLVSVLSGSGAGLLMMTGHQKTIMMIYAFFAATIFLFGMLVVEPYGVLGVAWVVSVSTTIQEIVTVIYAQKKTGVWCYVGLSDTRKFIKKYVVDGR